MHPPYPYQSLHVLRHGYHSFVLICHIIHQQLLLFFGNYNYLSAIDEFNSDYITLRDIKLLTKENNAFECAYC